MTKAAPKQKSAKKRLQTTFLLGVIACGITIVGLVTTGVVPYAWLLPEPPVNIDGVWTEQAVAEYASDSFELRPDGVYVNGRVVSTHYDWDGNTLSYQFGDDMYEYVYYSGQFMRKSPLHYTSMFSRQVL
ncbi:DUF2850 domain-containing protein [Photobacterium swingsii]|uniref:DUF2850 domain-containing protein n=1 Tax=Photobacterium swingsii TaxID=680026 RepID=UPI0040694F7B